MLSKSYQLESKIKVSTIEQPFHGPHSIKFLLLDSLFLVVVSRKFPMAPSLSFNYNKESRIY